MGFLDFMSDLSPWDKLNTIVKSAADPNTLDSMGDMNRKRSVGERLLWGLANIDNPEFLPLMAAKEERERKLAEEQQRKSAMLQLTQEMMPHGAVPTMPGVMGPLQPSQGLPPEMALMKLAGITGDPTSAIEFQINKPVRDLEMQLKRAQLAEVGRVKPELMETDDGDIVSINPYTGALSKIYDAPDKPKIPETTGLPEGQMWTLDAGGNTVAADIPGAETKEAKADASMFSAIEQSLGDAQDALDAMPTSAKLGPFTLKDPQQGPLLGRIADLYNVPEYENLAGAQNTLALQARNLLKLPASGFSDADREFLEQVVGGKYATRQGMQLALDRLEGMVQKERAKKGTVTVNGFTIRRKN